MSKVNYEKKIKYQIKRLEEMKTELRTISQIAFMLEEEIKATKHNIKVYSDNLILFYENAWNQAKWELKECQKQE